jgi:hypothetical protein
MARQRQYLARARAAATPRKAPPLAGISAWKPFRNALNEASGQEASGTPLTAALTQILTTGACGGKAFWGIVQR